MMKPTDEHTKETVVQRLETLLTVGDDAGWLLRVPSAWSAVPRASGVHFMPADMEAIGALAESAGDEFLFVVDVEKPLSQETRVWPVSPSYESLLELNADWGLNDIAVVPLIGEWIVLASQDDFLIFAGDKGAMSQLVPEGAEAAIVNFDSYVRDWELAVPSRLTVVASVDWRRASGREIEL